ncbi:MAG TPA: manganese efflux pump [Desulfobulbaceae bacterium]|nr:manganese efflux pump [Desulfobulbaceae bacterium]
MDLTSLLAIAVALAMDAFAVSLAAGAVLCPVTYRHCFRLGFHFGLFQGLMPIIGWLAGTTVQQYIVAWSHWIAFGLLGFIGTRMIREAMADDREDRPSTDPSRGINLVLLSIATSIDALAVGLSLAMIGVTIWLPALVIGLVALGFSVAGVLLGNRIGSAWGVKMEVAGGLVLIGIGVKILLKHLVSN